MRRSISDTPKAATVRPATARTITALVVALWLVVDLYYARDYLAAPWALFDDARIYLRAAAAWVAGADPWSASSLGFAFAAPPLTFVPYAPLTFLPEDLAVLVLGVLGLLAVVAGIRLAGLPWRWVIFPPLVQSMLVANPDAYLVLVLAASPGLITSIAPVLKVYAVVPVIAARRWAPMVAFCAVAIATAPILPWSEYVARLGEIAALLDTQSRDVRSAWGTPVLMGATAVALGYLGGARGGSLAVPALWPSPQLHYAAIATPYARPLVLAVALAVPLPFAAPVGVIVYAAALALGKRAPSLTVLETPV